MHRQLASRLIVERPVARVRPLAGTLVLTLALLALPGCQAPAPPVGPTEAFVRLVDRDAFLDSAMTILREHDLPPRRIDRDAGHVVTRPATSAQWFEFWRGDARGAYQLAESSMHTSQRVVTLSVIPTEPLSDMTPSSAPTASAPAEETYCVAVRVDKLRYSAPDRQVTTASGALGIYSERLPTEEGLRLSRARGESWVPQGRDGLLESYLLDRMIAASPQSRRVGRPAGWLDREPGARESGAGTMESISGEPLREPVSAPTPADEAPQPQPAEPIAEPPAGNERPAEPTPMRPMEPVPSEPGAAPTSQPGSPAPARAPAAPMGQLQPDPEKP